MTAASSLLGAMLITGNDAVEKVRGKVSADDFPEQRDKAIYEACLAIADDGGIVDPVTVLRRVNEAGVVVSSGYMREVMLSCASSGNYELYASELAHETAVKRLESAAMFAATELSAGMPAHETAARLKNECIELIERTCDGSPVVAGPEALRQFWEYRVELEAGRRRAALPTGYIELDEILGGGLVAEGLYVLAARPGVGKTTVALNIADKWASRNQAVLFVTLEQSVDQITAKRIAMESGMSSKFLLNSSEKSSGETWKKIHAASVELSKRPLYVNRIKNASVADVEKLAAQVSGLAAVVIDYLGYIRHTEGKNLYEKTTATSAALKRLARSLGLPVMCLVQLNRESEKRGGKKPMMSDLRDSGAIEQDADGIMLLHRPSTDLGDSRPPAHVPVSLELELCKNRHGATGSTSFDFYLLNGRVVER